MQTKQPEIIPGAEMDDSQDAARYRWLRQQPALELVSDGSRWTRPDGTPFFASHRLAAGDTQFSAQPTLDETIDAAMITQQSRALQTPP